MDDSAADAPLQCPSAQPEMAESVVFGVVGGTIAEPRVGYLDRPQPVTTEVLQLAVPVAPTEVFRFAAPCAGRGCQHFDGSTCQLVTKLVRVLPPVVERLPPCALRPRCRWWQQAGPQACRRCPQIVTETTNPSEILRHAADPAERLEEG